TVVARDTEKNVISDNIVRDIDPKGIWSSQTSCIQLLHYPGTLRKVRDNVVSRNVLDPGRNGKWAINLMDNADANNALVDNVFAAPGRRGMIFTGNAQGR